jgi:flagellar capping protein FliD
MDTDAMVKQAVAGEQAKIDSVLQSKQILEWQQEAYVE